jgi:class 3 adenylate cyclase
MIDGPVELHPLTLRFRDAAVEADFVRSVAQARRRELGVGVVLLIALFSAFILSDWFLFRESFVRLAAVRLGLVVPLLTVGASVILSERLRPLYERRLQEVLFYLALVATTGLVWMGALVVDGFTPERVMAASLGILVMLSFLYGFMRLRFDLALLLGVSATGGAMAILASRDDTPATVWSALLFFGAGVNAGGAWVTRTLELLTRRDFVTRRAIAAAEARAEALLANALPTPIARQLRDEDAASRFDREALAERHDPVTVLVADLVGFTPLSERLPPEELARHLDRLFSEFDRLAALHGVDKIKTLGDAWIAASGLQAGLRDHASSAAQLARAVLAAVERLRSADFPVEVRVGLSTGAAVAGVIGRTRFAFDLWGDAVDGAKRMEAAGAPGRVRVSATTSALLASDEWEPCGGEVGGGWLREDAPAGGT